MDEQKTIEEHKEVKKDEQERVHEKKSFGGWYDKYYKILLILPIILILCGVVYLISFYSANGDLMYKDSSLAGGTTITINQENNIDSNSLEDTLKSEFPDVRVREINDLTTGKKLALIVDSSVSPEQLRPSIESALNMKLDTTNSNIEFSGPTLSQNFYKQLLKALIFSFILMSIVIFILFRSFIPSAAIILAAVSDLIIPLVLVNLLGIKLSAAGIAAFLMIIGYGVDTNILLTTRVLKRREGRVNERILSSLKTGLFMTSTALLAVLPAFFIVTGLPDSFKQIFLILALGLLADIPTTWLTNAGIIKWYAHKRGLD